MKHDSENRKRRSIRLPEYDYTSPGHYFVTICTHERQCLFGDVVDGKMTCNDLGNIVLDWWKNIPDHFPFVDLDRVVVMPNHLHGIIIIRPNRGGGVTPPLRRPTLGQIVAYFKYKSTKQTNEMRGTPGSKLWQRNYFERIIRDEDELNKIREYIFHNPLRWTEDKEHPENIAL